MRRKLASIQKIVSLTPIKGADRIEIAQVLGWEVVVQKGIHVVGDDVVFYEIDAFLPAEDARYASFSERFTTWEGRRGMLINIADALQSAGGSVNMLNTVLLQDFILTCAQNNIHIEVKFGGTNGIS